MKRMKFMNRPTRLSDLHFEDYYENDDGDDWQTSKAQRLQIKRWRKLKHQLT